MIYWKLRYEPELAVTAAAAAGGESGVKLDGREQQNSGHVHIGLKEEGELPNQPDQLDAAPFIEHADPTQLMRPRVPLELSGDVLQAIAL